MNWTSTKFVTTSFSLVAALYCVANGYIDGTAYVTITLGVLANYAHHDVKQKGLNDGNT